MAFPREYEEQAKNFIANYAIENVFACEGNNLKNLTHHRLRTCRFCGKSSKAVKFKKRAHLISHLLGNKSLFSDYECDACNEKFGRYENDLADFLGITRVVNNVKGKKKPKFTSPGNFVQAEQAPFFNIEEALKIQREDINDQSFSFDTNTGLGSINYTKNPYIPINVYKAFLKMAMSCLKKEHLSNNLPSLQLLADDKHEISLNGLGQIGMFSAQTVGGYPHPIGCMFKKIKTDINLPTHVFMLFSQNNSYQIFLPYSLSDLQFYKQGALNFIWCPLFFDPSRYNPDIKVSSANQDFSSTEKVKEEKGSIQYQIDPEFLKNIHAYDPETGKTSPSALNFNEIKGLVVVETGTQVKFDKQ